MEEPKYEESLMPFMGLSEDIILEILLRLPLKSLGRFKLVSKSWHSLISKPDFAKSRLRFSNLTTNHPPLTLALQKHNIISSLKFRSRTDITKGVDLIPLDNQFAVVDDAYHVGYCFIVGSCDGLVCLYIKIKEKVGKDSLHVWNPKTNEDKRVALPVERGSSYLHVDSCWFGFVPSLDDYKIFLSYNVYKRGFVERTYIYSLRNPKWREIRVGTSFGLDSNSIFMNGALHCLVGHECMRIFDLVSETFESVPFLIETRLFPKPHQISLGVIGGNGRLCAMFVHHSEDEESMYELWVLEEYGKWDSWKKLYRIDLEGEIAGNCIGFLGFTYGGNICIREENGLRLVDPSRDPPSHAVCRGTVYKVADFVESLVSPFYLDLS